MLKWGKMQNMYAFDTQEKTDPRNTYSFLVKLSHGKLSLRSFRVSGKVSLYAWTFSGTVTVSVDQQWDDSKDLVEIIRDKFKEEEGASQWSNEIT